jgi:hypothetical protein
MALAHSRRCPERETIRFKSPARGAGRKAPMAVRVPVTLRRDRRSRRRRQAAARALLTRFTPSVSRYKVRFDETGKPALDRLARHRSGDLPLAVIGYRPEFLGVRLIALGLRHAEIPRGPAIG